MADKKIDLFVPGRLCLLGEHSDWAGRYRMINNKIEKGYAIGTGIEQGIYATAKMAENFIVRFKNDSKKYFKCKMEINELKKIAEKDDFWCYVAGVALYVKEQYNVNGLDITINNSTLPMKKGLSSSAAICVLVARAFNKIYNLHLNTIGEMNTAYNGEVLTPSRCGRLDQVCAFGKVPVLMSFDGDKLDIQNIKIGKDLHYVFADLNAKKDTIKILGDLNKCFPFAQNQIDRNVQKCLGELNKKIIFSSLECMEKGDVEGLGKLMIKAQEQFDKYVSPACPKELTSPILHRVLKDEKLKTLSYGGKGVGSQGDGIVQFLAKDKESQKLMKEYMEQELNFNAYTLTLNKTKPVTKAIIPVAGNGTRMYPITKLIKKSFLPIIDSDGFIKPAIMSILEELDTAGIEEICLVIDKDDQKYYDNFFNQKLSNGYANKLSSEMFDYDRKIRRIGKKISYIYQDEKLGLGHAVLLCSEFASDDPVLLVLGDQLYMTSNDKNCTQQLLENFAKTEKLTVSVCEVDLKDVSKYGILSGTIDGNNNYFVVDKMYEKPSDAYAKEYLYTIKNNEKKYYSVFGEYILTPEVFKELKTNIEKGNMEYGEYQLTTVLDSIREKQGMIAFIPDGEMLDVGDVDSYKKTLIKKMK